MQYDMQPEEINSPIVLTEERIGTLAKSLYTHGQVVMQCTVKSADTRSCYRRLMNNDKSDNILNFSIKT